MQALCANARRVRTLGTLQPQPQCCTGPLRTANLLSSVTVSPIIRLLQYFQDRLSLFYVFLSGIGFSLQALVIRLLAEDNFHASFQCVFFRGLMQLVLASVFIYFSSERTAGKGPSLFGDSTRTKFMLFMRSVAGFGGIAFSFLAVENISIGDTAVLTKLSPMLAAFLSFLMLGEPWRFRELCATFLSLVGAVLVARPPSIFGGSNANSTTFYTGVTYALISSVSAAFAYVYVRILGTTAKMPWANVCFSPAIGQIVLSIPCLYVFGQKLRLDISGYQLSMLILGGFIGAVSQILMTIGMQREKSAAATAMRMSDVAFGFLWQVLLTPDKLSLLSLGGAVLVSSGVIVIVAYKQHDEPTGELVEPVGQDEQQEAVEMSKLLDGSYDMEMGSEEGAATLSIAEGSIDRIGSLHSNTSITGSRRQ